MRSDVLSGKLPATHLSRRHLTRTLLMGGAALALAACGGQANPAGKPVMASNNPPAGKESVVVEMNDQNRFVPAAITIRQGDTVTWKNVGRTMPHNIVTDPNRAADKAHAVTPTGAEPFTSPMVMPGQSWSYTFTVAGDYTYFCQPHEALGMIGAVVVTAAAGA